LYSHTCKTFAFEGRKNVDRIAVSHDSRLLVAVDTDGRCLLINLRKGVILYRFNFKKPVLALAFSPDDKFLAVSHGNKVQLWNTPGLRRDFAPFVLHRTYGGHYGDILTISWAQDSQFFVTGAEDLSARVWSVHPHDGFKPVTLVGHRDYVVGAFFTEDNREIVTVGRDGAAYLWGFQLPEEEDEDSDDSMGDGDEKKPLPPAIARATKWYTKKKQVFKMDFAKVLCATFHAASGLLVVGFGNGTFGIYDLPDFNNIHTLSITQNEIETVAINSSGDWLAFASKKLGQLLVWEWRSETYVLKQQGHYFDLNVVDYSPDGRLLATGADDAKLKLWDTTSGFCYVTFSEHQAPVTGVKFTPNGQAVVSASLDGTVRAFDLNRYKNFRVMTTPEPVQFISLALDLSGQIVCAGTLDPFNIYVWSLQNGRLTDVLSGHTGPVTSLAFAPSVSAEPVLASGSWDHTVRLWNVYQNKSLIEPLAHSTDVLAVAFRPDGKQVCSATLNGYLNVWDVKEGEQVASIDGMRDIAGGRKSTDKISAKNNSISKYFTSVCYSADGTCVLAGGRSKFICIYETSQQILLKKFQLSHNRSLEGVLDYLNSSDLTASGLTKGELQAHTEATSKGAGDDLVGATRAVDPGSRRKNMEVLSKAVIFSPTGRSWAAATTEGLLIYALDETLTFDPFDLDEDITSESIKRTLKRQEYAKALLMSLHLNEEDLIQRCLEGTPLTSISLVANALKDTYLKRLMELLAKKIDTSPHLEFYLQWSLAILNTHGTKLRDEPSDFMTTLRALQKSIARHLHDLAKMYMTSTHLLLD
jgi:periodic tryptophan protein 2